ncbi:unnamed protein product, partial [Mesorhabditis spiculigera]
MNGRMSRLRRSLSRSLVQLNNVTFRRMRSLSRSVHQLNAVIPLSRQNNIELPDLPSQSEGVLLSRFASPQTYGQLSELVTKHNDALREVIAVFEEKVAMDFTYAKTMHKLAQRLQKVSGDAQCEIDRGWGSVAEQLTAHATLHSNLGSAFNDDLVQPLRSIYTNQQKTIRSANNLVDKETRRWKEKKEELAKAKRSLYVSSKELEKIEQLIDADQNMASKFSLRRKKLTETVKKGEDDYLYSTIDVESQRRATYGVLKKAVESIEAVERQRLAHSQTALGRVQRKMEQLAPNINQMFDRFASGLDVAVACDSSAYINSLQSASTAAHSVTLVDYFAENFSEIILGERRKSSLRRIAGLLDRELRTAYNKGLPIPAAGELTQVEFLEFLYYKINESVNSAEGGASRGYHRLATYMQKSKDKQGLTNSSLIIPLSESLTGNDQRNECFVDRTDDYDRISDEGFYNSSGPRSTDEGIESMNTYSIGFSQAASSPPASVVETITNSPPEIGFKYPSQSAVDQPIPRQTTIIDDPDPAVAVCEALYDFNGTDSEELTIKAGERLIVESRLGDDWLIGRTIQHQQDQQERRGRFPTTYVAFQKQNPLTPVSLC